MKMITFALLAFCVAGCAGMTGAQVVDKTIAVGGDVLTCAADDYSAVDGAIRDGGANWVGAIIGLFQCIPTVIRDITAKEQIAELRCPGESTCMLPMASSDAAILPDVKYTRLSRGAKRRLAAANVLGQVLNRSVKQ
jgi:hypothetical protein